MSCQSVNASDSGVICLFTELNGESYRSATIALAILLVIVVIGVIVVAIVLCRRNGYSQYIHDYFSLLSAIVVINYYHVTFTYRLFIAFVGHFLLIFAAYELQFRSIFGFIHIL